MEQTDIVRKLACLIASYEMDAPHTSSPTLDVGSESEQFYPLILWETIINCANDEHNGDCVKQPQTCTRCWAEDVIHKATWIAGRLKLS